MVRLGARWFSVRHPVLPSLPLTPPHPLHRQECILGAESEEAKRLRETLVDCFRERIQIQSSLIELQSQNVHNLAEVSRRQVAVGSVLVLLAAAHAAAQGGEGDEAEVSFSLGPL